MRRHSSPSRLAPSRSEYCVWRWRWTKSAGIEDRLYGSLEDPRLRQTDVAQTRARSLRRDDGRRRRHHRLRHLRRPGGRCAAAPDLRSRSRGVARRRRDRARRSVRVRGARGALPAGRRGVRLSARGVPSAGRVPVRLGFAPDDPGGRPRRGRGHVRALRSDVDGPRRFERGRVERRGDHRRGRRQCARGEARQPAADALRRIYGPGADRLVAAAIAISAFGFLDLTLLAQTRIYFAMGRDGVFLPGLARLHPKFQTPALAILLQAGWGILLALTGTFAELVDSVVFGDWIFFGLTGAAIFVFRRRRPVASREPGAFRT